MHFGRSNAGGKYTVNGRTSSVIEDKRAAVEGCVSEWRAVTRGVPQGSVLGPLLRVNDLEENVIGLISKFADDAKVGGIADSDEDRQRIQQDIDRLETWAERRQTEFNPDKCEAMHFGRSNAGGKCTAEWQNLLRVLIGRGIWVYRYTGH